MPVVAAWKCEYGILAAGSVGTACGHVNMGHCVLKGLHNAYGNVNMGHAYISICNNLHVPVVAAGRVGIACGNLNMGYCLLGAAHNAYGNVNMGYWLLGAWEMHVDM